MTHREPRHFVQAIEHPPKCVPSLFAFPSSINLYQEITYGTKAQPARKLARLVSDMLIIAIVGVGTAHLDLMIVSMMLVLWLLLPKDWFTSFLRKKTPRSLFPAEVRG